MTEESGNREHNLKRLLPEELSEMTDEKLLDLKLHIKKECKRRKAVTRLEKSRGDEAALLQKWYEAASSMVTIKSSFEVRKAALISCLAEINFNTFFTVKLEDNENGCCMAEDCNWTEGGDLQNSCEPYDGYLHRLRFTGDNVVDMCEHCFTGALNVWKSKDFSVALSEVMDWAFLVKGLETYMNLKSKTE